MKPPGTSPAEQHLASLLQHRPLRWHDWLVVGWVVLVTAGACWSFPRAASCALGGSVLLLLVGRWRNKRRLSRFGYRVYACGRDTFLYEEAVEGGTRRLPFSCELMAKGPRVLYVLAPDAWESEMPGWTEGRRGEIYARIRLALCDNGVNYVEHPAAETGEEATFFSH